MCFSAMASFVAGSALSVGGVVILKKAKKRNEIPFAAIPLLFGIQQLSEGAVWLSFGSPVVWNSFFSHVFLLFAYVLWPIFIPFSIRLLENDISRKKLFSIFQVAGIGVGLYLLFFMLYHSIISQVAGKSIAYTISIPHPLFAVSLYVLVTCGSLLFSSNKTIKIFGILASVFFAIAYYFYTVTFASVWCFFSALLSGVIYWYFKDEKKHAYF